MSLVARLFPRARESRALGEESWLLGLLGYPETAAGVQVGPSTALTFSAVYAAVRVLAESVAQLPLRVYKRLEPRGKEPDPSHWLYPLLYEQPNPWQTSFEWREMMQGHVALRGNAYSQIVTGRGPVDMLVPLHPDRVEVVTNRGQYVRVRDEYVYRYRPSNGDAITIFQSEMLHLRGLSTDGVVGLSPVTLARENIGAALAAERHGARFFSNDQRPGGVLEVPEALSDQAFARLKDDWAKAHSGAGAHRTAILEEGTKWHQVGLANDDAQWLQSRKFSITEIARWFRLPPHMLGDLERATFTNIEHMGLEFLQYSLQPWLVRWEQRLSRSLLTEASRKSHFIKFAVQGLLRGDVRTRYEAYAIGRQNGWLSANDIRELEDINPLPGEQGDVYLVPLNMIPAETLVDGGLFSPTPKPDAVAGDGDAPPSARRALLPAREQRNVNMRGRYRTVYAPLIRETSGRAYRREIAAVRRLLSNLGTSGGEQGFDLAMAEFYAGNEPKFLRDVAGAFNGYGQVLKFLTEEQYGAIDGTAYSQFVNEYTQSLARRETQSSVNQLRSVLQDTPPNEQADAIEQRLTEWEAGRAEKLGRRESVRAGEAFVKFGMAAAGVIMLRWAAVGDTCPLCQSLDGKVVSVERVFVDKGITLDVDGQEPLVTHSNVGHPPLHDGCDCFVVAG